MKGLEADISEALGIKQSRVRSVEHRRGETDSFVLFDILPTAGENPALAPSVLAADFIQQLRTPSSPLRRGVYSASIADVTERNPHGTLDEESSDATISGVLPLVLPAPPLPAPPPPAATHMPSAEGGSPPPLAALPRGWPPMSSDQPPPIYPPVPALVAAAAFLVLLASVVMRWMGRAYGRAHAGAAYTDLRTAPNTMASPMRVHLTPAVPRTLSVSFERRHTDGNVEVSMEADVEMSEDAMEDGDTIKEAIQDAANELGMLSGNGGLLNLASLSVTMTNVAFEVFWTNRAGELQFLSGASDIADVMASDAVTAVATPLGDSSQSPRAVPLDVQGSDHKKENDPGHLVHSFF